MGLGSYVDQDPFLASSGNYSGPKSNIQIKIERIRARVLASKLLRFVSSTDGFIMLDVKQSLFIHVQFISQKITIQIRQHYKLSTL